MANNVEKFVIDLGFNDKDIQQLKNLLKLQKQSEKAAKVHNKQQRDAKAKELALERKKLQMKKLIARAEKEGVDVTKYKKSLAASKKIATLEKRRIELDELHWKAKEANAKKIQAAKNKELNTEKKITQEVIKQKQFNNMPPKSLFEKSQKDLEKRRQSSLNLKRERDYQDRRVGLIAEKIGLPSDITESLKAQARAAVGDRIAIRDLNLTLQEYAQKQRNATMRTRKANLAMQGLNDSTRHLVRSYASVFAVLGASQQINQTGQKFEAMQSAMLAATGTAQEAGEEIQFLDEMTSRLGLSLVDTSDAYTKFLFASKGKLDQSESRELFEGLSELGTTLGISKERMKLSMNAISQMMNKGKISSEELRLQLAESLPSAIQIFARAIGKSEAELFKMMENGELLASEVLPKVAKEMKAVAAVGLDSKLDTLRVAQGQFFNELEKAQKVIFDNGFSEGLKDLFQTLTQFSRENQDALKGLGKVFKTAFNLIEGAVKVILPIIGTLAETFGTLHGAMEGAFGDSTAQKMGSNIAMIVLALNPLYRLGMLILGVFDEIAALFTTDKVGILELAVGKDINFSNANISPFELLTSATNPLSAYRQMSKLSDADNVYKDFDRKQVLQPLKVEVKMEEGLEMKINDSNAKSNNTYILSGAY